MVKGATTTFVMTLPAAAAIGSAAKVIFTLRQDEIKLEKTRSALDIIAADNEVRAHLSQQETLAFRVGTAKLQLNWLYANGERGNSKIEDVTVEDNLHPEVMEL